jgi:hypothetical protein
MIFLPIHAKVLEVSNNPDACNFCFYNTAASLNLGYRGIAPQKQLDGLYNFSAVNVKQAVEEAHKLLVM